MNSLPIIQPEPAYRPPDILNLSASSMKTYEQCPRKYYYQYVRKVDIPRKEWPHTRFGNFVHAVLEDFHNALMEDPTLDRGRLMAMACKAHHDEFNIDPEQKFQAQEILLQYLQDLSQTGLPKVIANEQKFKIAIGDKLFVNGFIDRIDEQQDEYGQYKLCDYKSGASKYLDEFQLLVYSLYMLEEHPEIETIKADYLVLKEHKTKGYVFNRADIEAVRDKIKSIAAAIREDYTWSPKPQFLCNYCDYQDICEDSKRFKKRSTSKEGW